MSNALLHVQTILQTRISLPHLFNTSSSKLSQNPHFNSKTQFLFRNIVYSSTFLIFIFSICRLVWLRINWNTQIDHKTEQLMVYIVTLCLTAVGVSSYPVLIKYSRMLLLVVNQRLFLVPLLNQRPNKFYDTLSYLFAVNFCSFPLLVLGVPLHRNYLPIQILWNYFIGPYFKQGNLEAYIQAIESVTYVVIVSQCAGAIFSIFLLLIVTTEGINMLTEESLQIYKHSFMQNYKTNLIVRLLIQCVNITARHFLYGVCQVNVLLVSTCAYGLINLDDLPIATMFAAFVIIIVCLLFCFGVFVLMDIPSSKMWRFRQNWQRKVGHSPTYKRILKAIPMDSGYKLGIFGNIRRIGGPKTLDLAIDCTINLTLVT